MTYASTGTSRTSPKAVIHRDKRVIDVGTVQNLRPCLNEFLTLAAVLPLRSVSEACTLICLLVAQRVSQSGLLIGEIDRCPEFNVVMAEAMAEGNATHAWIVKEKLVPHPYLNTEEALKFGGRSLTLLKEWVYIIYLSKTRLRLRTFRKDI